MNAGKHIEMGSTNSTNYKSGGESHNVQRNAYTSDALNRRNVTGGPFYKGPLFSNTQNNGSSNLNAS